MSRLLVVEDEERLQAFVVRVLEADGHLVDVAGTGPDGVRRTHESVYDLVVLDLMLPGFDGVEALRRILNHDPEQRVIVLSAVSDVASRVQCLRMGATDYLTKPFAGAELVARVQARLRAPKSAAAQRWLRVGQTTLDLERQRLDIGGKVVALSHRELLLVGYLMRRAGEVCSREELLSGVWGYDDETSNVLDVTVRRVRAKIPLPLIETVRHVGYAFTIT
jgi:two-component system copper resistance phosphate regulon response regulator CusR